jgi:hypothetical protein
MPTTRGLGKSHPVVSCRDEKCRSRFIPAGQLDELVWKDLCDVLTHPQTIAEALHRAQGGLWLPQELQARRENVRKARVSLTQQTERLTDAYLAAVLPLEEYQRRRRELEHRQQGLAEQARQLEVSVGRHDELAGMVQSMEAFCQRVQQGLASATFDEMRHLIELLIDRVVVTDEEVEIRYVIPTSPTSEHVRFCHLRLDYFNVPSGSDGSHHLREGCAGRSEHKVIALLLRISASAAHDEASADHHPGSDGAWGWLSSRRAEALWFAALIERRCQFGGSARSVSTSAASSRLRPVAARNSTGSLVGTAST